MWNIKIDRIIELQRKICLFGNFMYKNLFFTFFKLSFGTVTGNRHIKTKNIEKT